MTKRLHFNFSLFTFMLWRRKWQPTAVFLPGESQGREAWWAAVYGVAQSRTQLKQRSSNVAAAALTIFFTHGSVKSWKDGIEEWEGGSKGKEYIYTHIYI